LSRRALAATGAARLRPKLRASRVTAGQDRHYCHEGVTEAARARARAQLLDKTGVKPREVDALITNCCTFNPVPSLSAAVVNHFKFKQAIKTYHLGGMGCAASVIAMDLAHELLQARAPGGRRAPVVLARAACGLQRGAAALGVGPTRRGRRAARCQADLEGGIGPAWLQPLRLGPPVGRGVREVALDEEQAGAVIAALGGDHGDGSSCLLFIQGYLMCPAAQWWTELQPVWTYAAFNVSLAACCEGGAGFACADGRAGCC